MLTHHAAISWQQEQEAAARRHVQRLTHHVRAGVLEVANRGRRHQCLPLPRLVPKRSQIDEINYSAETMQTL